MEYTTTTADITSKYCRGCSASFSFSLSYRILVITNYAVYLVLEL